MDKVDFETSIDDLERELVALETLVGRVRQRQAELLRSLDVRQVHKVDGASSLQEWVRGRLDVGSQTARDLVDAARQLPHYPGLADETDGLSFERAVTTARLLTAGADSATVRHSFGLDLAGVDRLRTRRRRLDRYSERDIYVDRSVWFQDSLDNTKGRITGELPGFEYTVVRDAIEERAEQFGDLPGPTQTKAQRCADALVAVAQDSREPEYATDGKVSERSKPLVTVFVDGADAPARGEVGAEIEFGPRVGPAVLDRMLCEGRIQLVGLENGKPVVTSDGTRAIPPAVERFVKRRDGGCVVAGCHSRYRLQVHHIIFRGAGGDHDPDNLATLCWFHHHVVIHGLGFRIDPTHHRRIVASSATSVVVPSPRSEPGRGLTQ